MSFSKYILVVLIGSFVVVSCQNKTAKADTIISNAVIWTGDSEQPYAESLAIKGDTILAIGTTKEVLMYQGAITKTIDVNGKFITPGFIDSHVHLLMGGNALLSVELRDANTKAAFINRIAEYAQTLQKERWILEGNWDHTLWGGILPTKDWIDAYTANNPVALYRIDGHMILANSLALKIAGIDKNTPVPEGGEIVKDENGEPTGILKGHAMTAVLNKIPPMTQAEKEKAIRAAQQYLVSNGVTSVHDVDSLGTYTAAKKLLKAKELSIRIYVANPLNEYEDFLSVNRTPNKWLKTGLLKGFVDGSLGSHTAAFKRPYTDKPEDKGYFINSEENILKWAAKADTKGFQITVHAIGDSAISSLLKTYESIIKVNGNKDRRLRIEHVQHLDTEDLNKLSELNIIASMQPYHAIDDGRWAEELIGSERAKTTYAFKSLLDTGTTVTFGSDWPVAPASPLLGIYAATTRRTIDGKNPDGWVSEQKITTEDALLAYTKNAAFASFDDKFKGTLEAGKLADFVVISENILKTDPVTIKEVSILQTYVGGKKVFDTED